jgi:hypothetical protein
MPATELPSISPASQNIAQLRFHSTKSLGILFGLKTLPMEMDETAGRTRFLVRLQSPACGMARTNSTGTGTPSTVAGRKVHWESVSIRTADA